MKFTILSLNVRIWTKHKNPFSENFWLKRTNQQAELFKKYSPDIICVQERIYPVGRLLLGLKDYEVFGSRSCRLPIFVKKSFCDRVGVLGCDSYRGTSKENGHGFNTISILWGDGNKEPIRMIEIQNCHLSWEDGKLAREISRGFGLNTIVCGDFNMSIHTFYKKWRVAREDEPLYLFYDEGDEPTYISYENPDNKRNIDHFGVTDLKCKCTHRILPERTSDHFPILAKFII